jgi:hypothetical protein
MGNSKHDKELDEVTRALEEKRLHARTELLASEKEYYSRLVRVWVTHTSIIIKNEHACISLDF